ncbi:hypothetical protein E2562_028004 [Oryza meyeriana var. granulata]|uniref:Uncharacterized protein n=1 Tax=Oryza meyeriana var. granulata TaxID=110450 RepID=A0A6G1CU35_9ORYZ|nr:hypothetical protein E2562_028004 [Oryza meyeriana var. granulata]
MRPENHALQAAMISIAPVLQLCLGDLIRYLPYPYQKKGTQVKDVWANTTYKSKMVHPLTHNSELQTDGVSKAEKLYKCRLLPSSFPLYHPFPQKWSYHLPRGTRKLYTTRQ